MTDILTVLQDVAALITAGESVALLYFTFQLRAENRTLREATESLESIQVRPKVVLGQSLYFDAERKAPFTGAAAFSLQDVRAKGKEIVMPVEVMDIRKKVYEESIVDMDFRPTLSEEEAQAATA